MPAPPRLPRRFSAAGVAWRRCIARDRRRRKSCQGRRKGDGRIALWGGPVREIRPGDTVWIAPGEKHWHGAGPDTAMMHIALQEALDGKHVTWLEHVSDEQYGAKPGG